jgi:hypothetical protein
MHDKLNLGSTTLLETAFHQSFSRDLKEAEVVLCLRDGIFFIGAFYYYFRSLIYFSSHFESVFFSSFSIVFYFVPFRFPFPFSRVRSAVKSTNQTATQCT